MPKKEIETPMPLRYQELMMEAMGHAKVGNYELAGQIIRYMIQIWPERLIAKGERYVEEDVKPKASYPES